MKTVIELLEEKYPEDFKLWDKTTYAIISPTDIYDEAVFTIALYSKNGSYMTMNLNFEGAK